MCPDAEFKREISPIMEAILIAAIVNEDECKILLYHYLLYNIFTNYVNFFILNITVATKEKPWPILIQEKAEEYLEFVKTDRQNSIKAYEDKFYQDRIYLAEYWSFTKKRLGARRKSLELLIKSPSSCDKVIVKFSSNFND
jgi:hypothetical protein